LFGHLLVSKNIILSFFLLLKQKKNKQTNKGFEKQIQKSEQTKIKWNGDEIYK